MLNSSAAHHLWHGGISSLPASPILRFLSLPPEPLYSHLIHRVPSSALWNYPYREMSGTVSLEPGRRLSEGGRIRTRCRMNSVKAARVAHTEKLSGEDLKSNDSRILQSPLPHPRNASWMNMPGRCPDHSKWIQGSTLPTPSPECLSSSDFVFPTLPFFGNSSLGEKLALSSSSKLFFLSFFHFHSPPPTLHPVSLAFFGLLWGWLVFSCRRQAFNPKGSYLHRILLLKLANQFLAFSSISSK